jgi:hypothetical protein
MVMKEWPCPGKMHERVRLPLLLLLPLVLGACAAQHVRPVPAVAALNAIEPHAAAPRAPASVAPALRDAAAALLAGAAPADYAHGSVRADAHGDLQVYVHAAVTPALVAALQQAGLRGASAVPELGVVQGWVSPGDLDALARVAGVDAITPPRYAVTR